jgi:hypothetical protein
MIEYCVCGHIKKYHEGGSTDALFPCWTCYDGKDIVKSLHVFKLDNLKYIEDLAKERNLV